MPEKAKKNDISYLREIEIKYKKRKSSSGEANKPIRAAEQVVELFSDLQNESKEKMIAINLDAKCRILCFEVVAIGSVSSLYTRPMEVFRTAFPVNAHGAIVIHNHPSGDPSPSQDDEKFTQKLLNMSNDMGLVFFDHIIIGEDGYYSFAEHGKLDDQ